MEKTEKERDEVGRGARERSEKEKIVIYGTIALVLIALALTFTFVLPHASSSLARCNEILLSQDKSSCLFSLALSSQNATVCSYINDGSQNSCYMQVALETLEPETCTYASNYNYVYSCIDEIANKTDSYAACNYLKAPYAGNCIEELAIRFANATACSALSNPIQSDVCSSGIYLALAISGKNQSYCAKIYNTTNQTVVSQIVSLSGERPGSSSSLGLGGLGQTAILESGGFSYSSRDYCYFSVASLSGDNSSCAKLANSTLRSLCDAYSYKTAPTASNSLANAASLATLCKSYTGSNLTSCEEIASLDEALSARNATFCSQIVGTSEQYQCYASLARAYNDTAYCGYIPNATANQACVEDIYYNVT